MGGEWRSRANAKHTRHGAVPVSGSCAGSKASFAGWGEAPRRLTLKFAYADPPYPGCAKAHYAEDPSGIPAAEVDHAALIERLGGFDGWALSTHSPALRSLWPLCPEGTRCAAWVKPFAVFRPGQRVAYAWEPVLWWGGRPKKTKQELTVRDWVAVSPPVFTGKAKGATKGQKPYEFCTWMFEMLGMEPEDEFHDLFPGSGAVGTAWAAWRRQIRLPLAMGRGNAFPAML